jgi:hypothetical protein
MTKKYFYLLLIIVALASCGKQTQTINTIPISTLCPLAVGNTFLYRLDSTVFNDFGSSSTIKSYLAKDSVESSFIDVTGQTNFRIFRYITDTLKTKPWAYSSTQVATITNNTIEYLDNNLRYIKLANPVSVNTIWSGNSYINTDAAEYSYLKGWNYQYQNLAQSYNCLKGNIDSTYTVLQQDEQTPTTGFDPRSYCDKKYSIEVYAKGVGLVYKKLLYYVWQNSSAKFEDGSYGIKLNLIDYK